MKILVQYYKKLANRLFFEFFVKHSDRFSRLKGLFIAARIPMIFETYLSMMHLTTLLIFVMSILVSALINIYFKVNAPTLLIFTLAIPGLVYLLFYLYPLTKLQSHRNSIEANLPFAILYLNTLIKAGISPQKAFEILSKRNEFGGVSKEAKYILSQMKILGIDFITALINASRTTASNKFKSFLYAFIETIKSEGDLRSFLEATSRNALIDFKLKLKEFDEKLSFIITIYTALFIAFPLIMITLVTVFAIVLKSSTTLSILKFGVLIILPLIHLLFLYFVLAVRPKV